MIDYILFTIGFLGLLIGTITDFRKREVADWVNFGLMFAGLGLRLIFSIVSGDWWFFILAALVIAIMYLLGLAMFYTGQWGGGDSKMLMGLAALFTTYNISLFGFNPVIPDFIQTFFNWSFPYNLSFFFHFLFNSLMVGGLYGIVWSLILIAKHYTKYKKEFAKQKIINKKYLYIGTSVAIVFFMLSLTLDLLFKVPLVALSFMILVMPWLFMFSKAVENACMIRMMKTKDLTEGEWIVDNVYQNKKLICGPKDLGVSIKQIAELKKAKIEAVKVKIGIPFVPAFFIAFIVTAVVGNVFLIVL